MADHINKRNRIFYRELLYPRHMRMLIIIYITLKATGNLLYGESYLVGLIGGVRGILVYWLAMYTINFASTSDDEQTNLNLTADNVEKSKEAVIARRGLLVSFLYFVFLFILNIDKLQRNSFIMGRSLMSYVPGYDMFLIYLDSLSRSVSEMVSFILPFQIQNIIMVVIFYILIPSILFRLLGYSFEGQFSLRNSQAALPILALAIILFVKNGLEKSWGWSIAYSFIYPALGEAFFHRGIVYRSVASVLKNPTKALMIGATIYCTIYFPGIYFRICAGSITLCLPKMGEVFLFGLLMTYGYHKTGTLLPWILIQALTNSMFF